MVWNGTHTGSFQQKTIGRNQHTNQGQIQKSEKAKKKGGGTVQIRKGDRNTGGPYKKNVDRLLL